MAVGTGLQVMAAMMNADLEAVRAEGQAQAGPGGAAPRHRGRLGHPRWPTGACVPAPDAAADGGGELPVPAYELFSQTEVLGRMAMERMLAGLSTRR